MDKYEQLLQDDGANLSETNDAEKSHPEVNEDLYYENLPDDRSYQDTTKHDDETNITVQTISFYGSGEILATPQNLNLKPGSHPPQEGNDHDHYISASFVARISGRDVQTVVDWARSGSYFLKLEFHLTGNHLPRFTSRVLLVEDQEQEISLSGGLGFALRLLKLVKTPDSGRPPVSRRHHFPPPRRKRLLDRLRAEHQRPWRTIGPGSQPPPFTLQNLEHPARFPQCRASSIQSQPPSSSSSRSLPSLHDLDDQFSVSTDYTEDSMETPPLTLATTETNWLDGVSETVGILNSSPEDFLEANVPLLGETGEWTPCHVKVPRLPRETFEQQKRMAQAMYAHNGDTSGMVSLMTLATTSPFSNYPSLFYNTTQN